MEWDEASQSYVGGPSDAEIDTLVHCTCNDNPVWGNYICPIHDEPDED